MVYSNLVGAGIFCKRKITARIKAWVWRRRGFLTEIAQSPMTEQKWILLVGRTPHDLKRESLYLHSDSFAFRLWTHINGVVRCQAHGEKEKDENRV